MGRRTHSISSILQAGLVEQGIAIPRNGGVQTIDEAFILLDPSSFEWGSDQNSSNKCWAQIDSHLVTSVRIEESVLAMVYENNHTSTIEFSSMALAYWRGIDRTAWSRSVMNQPRRISPPAYASRLNEITTLLISVATAQNDDRVAITPVSPEVSRLYKHVARSKKINDVIAQQGYCIKVVPSNQFALVKL